MSIKNTKRGFTLIELLVVIAIIGILSGVVLASLAAARERARNSQRISDLRQIALALELDNDAAGTYAPADPDSTVPDILQTRGYLPTMPLDPTTDAQYSYSTTGTTYCVGTNLEGTTPAVPRNHNAACAASLGPTIDYAIAP